MDGVLLSVSIFLVAELLVGISLTIFCINVIGTVLKGKIAVGIQKTEIDYDKIDDVNLQESYYDKHKSKADEDDSGRVDFFELKQIPPVLRWVSILGISSWFPRKYRIRTPAVSIVVVVYLLMH